MRTNLIFLCLCVSVGILFGFAGALDYIVEIEETAVAKMKGHFAEIEREVPPLSRELVAKVAAPFAEMVGTFAALFAETKVFLFFSVGSALVGVAVWAAIMLVVRFFAAIIGKISATK